MDQLPLFVRGGGLVSCDVFEGAPRDCDSASGLFACSLIVVLCHEKVLFGRNRRRGLWEVPGGAIEPGESAHDAALRELTEETGIRTSHAALVARAELVSEGDSTIYVAAVFHIVLDRVPFLQPSDELEEFRWWSPLDDPWDEMNLIDASLVCRTRGRHEGQ